jgi:hypothetical protein
MSKRVFFHGAVPDAAGAIITAATQTRAIDAATVINHTGSAATLTVWQVPNAGSRANANLLVNALSIADGTTVTLAPLVNHAIAQNASIHAEASAASALTLIVSGRVQ